MICLALGTESDD